MLTRQKVTLEDFIHYVHQDENTDQTFELINGEIIEAMPNPTRVSELGLLVAVAVLSVCRANHVPCHTSGADGAYHIQGHVLVPDFAYKRTLMSDEYPDPVAPEWVVEVISPIDKARDIRAKREIYLQAGILLWEIYPDLERIDVYAPGQSVTVLGINDTLNTGEVIPGFTLPVQELFRK